MLRSLGWTVLVALAVLAGCGGDDDDGGACPEPLYEGDATDEAWRTMVDGDDGALEGDAHAVTLAEPADGAVVSTAGTGVMVSWSSPLARAWPGGRPAVRVAAAQPTGVLDDLASLVEGTAWAHLPPVTGDIYWVRIAVPGRACSVEAVTTELSWNVTGDAWQAVRAAGSGATLSIDVTSAYLTENRITEGPYRPATPRTVTLGP